jgi:hypothetical protein
MIIPGLSPAMNFYINRGYDDGTVNLNRNSTVMTPTGLFCCEVPSAAGAIQPLCANSKKVLLKFISIKYHLKFTCIVSIGVEITSIGSLTAGQNYSLDCSVTETADQATYKWFNSNGTLLVNTSQLQFSPLLASHAGNYTCWATVGSVVVENSDKVEINCKISWTFTRSGSL